VDIKKYFVVASKIANKYANKYIKEEEMRRLEGGGKRK
jgi:hypothetical protein